MKTQGLKGLGLLLVLLAGFLMVAPSAFAASSNGYSAVCKDGTSWSGKSKRGTCHGHKGVKSWTSEGGSSASTESSTKKSHESKSRSSKKSGEAATTGVATPVAAAGGVTATCKDGSSWSGKSKRGACHGHKGVANWSGDGTSASAKTTAKSNAAPARPAVVSQRTATRTASTGGSMGAPAPGGGNGKVWVNTGSKTYHCQGTKWYGTTKHGEYMTQSQAKAQGYHADHGKACSG
ncbi:MAG: hypothetical protein ACREPS_05855 [Rhodanobacteraceae bacterium]